MEINNRKISIVTYSTETNWVNEIPNENWLCVLVDNDKPRRYLEEVHSKILDHNVCHVCAIGKQCELNHDLIDEEIVIRDVENEYLPPFHIRTTWDNDFEEGVWFAVYAAFHANVDIDKVVFIDMTDGKEIERINTCLEKIK